jgi:phosphatidylglycerol:prolipoprotein diacylglycerol transferase
MHPILFRLGTLPVRTYTVLLDLGLLAGLALAFWLWRRRGQPAATFVDAVACALAGAVAGGRALYVALNWAYFSVHTPEIFTVWTGGVSFHGAVVGGALGITLYALLARRPGWALADAGALGLALGGVFGWAACLAAGCAYGIVGEGAFFWLSPDIYGIEAPRLAVQVFGMAHSALTLFILLLLVKGRARAGLLLGVYLLAYMGGQFVLEFGRGDETLYFGGLRIAQILDAVLALAGVGLILLLRLRRPTQTQ